jgi:hypothetical protein
MLLLLFINSSRCPRQQLIPAHSILSSPGWQVRIIRCGRSRRLVSPDHFSVDGSIIEATDVHDASIGDLVLDGNVDETRDHDGCRAAGVYLLRSHRIGIKGVEIKNFRGDAISFQACTDVVVRDCELHHNSGIGIHPGSGSVRYVMAGNQIHDNGSHGIYYCLRSSHSDCHANRIEHNGDCGISVGERDSHHLIRDNAIVGNGRAGIEFRQFVYRGGNYVRMEGNRIGPNCRTKGDFELAITAGHHDLYFVKNHLSPAKGG